MPGLKLEEQFLQSLRIQCQIINAERRRTNASPSTARDMCIGISVRACAVRHIRPGRDATRLTPASQDRKGLICSPR